MNLIIRILGNNLPGLHGKHQTYNNLKFTLKNENNFKNTDKVFILNRIVDKEEKAKIIKILKEHNKKYIEIPFKSNEFNNV